MSHFKSIGLTAILIGLLYPTIGSADISAAPDVLHYQAHLADSNGLNVDGDVRVEVRVYDSPTAGELIYAESHNIHVDRGVVRLSIGEGTGLGSFSGIPLPMERLAQAGDLYVELHINGEKIEPRQHAGYQNYALLSQYARSADNLSGSLTIPSASLPDMPASKTYGALAPARIPSMDASRVSGVLSADRIPSNLTLNKLTAGTLGEGIISQIDSSSITTGTFNGGVLPDLMYSQTFYAEVGDVSNWGTIPLPPDFAYNQCKMIAGIKDLNMPDDKMADDLFVDVTPPSPWGGFNFSVQCEAEYATSVCDPLCSDVAVRHPCTARYLMVCAR